MMKWLWVLIVWTTALQAQDLIKTVRQINPALFLNNMDNLPVYHQALIDRNSLVFTRLYTQVSNERKEQAYHYCFLNERKGNWLLEIRLDQHDFKVSDGQNMQAVRSSDFGVVVYRLQGETWTAVTNEALPTNFRARFEEQFPHLQRGGWGYYYYNQDPECVVHPTWKRQVLHFEQNGKKVLCLAWRNKRFVWK
jgi:hypothetical protein